MRIASTLQGFPPARVRKLLKGLPAARRYRLEVKPLRYRTGLYEVLGRKGSAETARDRYALQHFRRLAR